MVEFPLVARRIDRKGLRRRFKEKLSQITRIKDIKFASSIRV